MRFITIRLELFLKVRHGDTTKALKDKTLLNRFTALYVELELFSIVGNFIATFQQHVTSLNGV